MSRRIRRFVSPSHVLPLLRPLLLTAPLPLSLPCGLHQNARHSRLHTGRVHRICHRTHRDNRSPKPTRRRYVRFCSSFSASSCESEMLFVRTAAPPIRDQSEESPPTSNARLEPSRRRLRRFGPRPLRRRSSHGQQPSRHVDECVERPCPSQHRQFARRLDSEPARPYRTRQSTEKASRRCISVKVRRVSGCCFAWCRPSLHPFALPLILSTCSPFILRPRPGTVVRERAQISLLKLSPVCPRETSSPLKFPSAQLPGALSSTGRTCTRNGKVDNKDDGQ
jgi:hypothetical protein